MIGLVKRLLGIKSYRQVEEEVHQEPHIQHADKAIERAERVINELAAVESVARYSGPERRHSTR